METTVRSDFISWDWKEQPDFDEVEASGNGMLSDGATRIYLTLVADTGDDSYCLVVSDADLTPDEATRAYEDWEGTFSPDDPPDSHSASYVWRRR